MRRITTLTLASALSLTSCANFRKLGKVLKILDDPNRVSGVIEKYGAAEPHWIHRGHDGAPAPVSFSTMPLPESCRQI